MRFHLRNLFLAAGIVPLLVLSAKADRYVAQAGQTPDSVGGYTTWSGASSNIQAAVTAANPGETVWASNGLYRSTSTPVVTIAKSLNLRSVVPNTTAVIDGQGARRGILVTLSEPLTVLIEGFTVSNCLLAGNGPGGGIYLDNTAADVAATGTVRNCRIIQNTAYNTATGYGGGLCARGYAGSQALLFRIENCTIVSNYAGSGGGGVDLQNGRFIVENCRIAFNTVDLWDPFAVPPVAAVNNRSAGGISIAHPGPGSVVRNCVIENNRASTWGGGLLSRYDGELLVENCVIRSNMAPRGAGLCIAGHTGMPTNILRNCLISHNWAFTNLIAGNTTRGGGGIMIGDDALQAGKNVRVENCTVVSNTAAWDGGGVYVYTANGLAAVNSIFYGNNAIHKYSDAYGTVYSNYYGTATWTNCLVGTGNVLPGSGNITTKNPEFVDFNGADYRLTLASPCRNSGYYLSWMSDARDLDGKSRIQPTGGNVDIGCYEYQPTGFVITIR